MATQAERTPLRRSFISMIREWEQADLVDLLSDLIDDDEISDETLSRIYERCRPD